MNRSQSKSATDLHRNRTGRPGVIDLRSGEKPAAAEPAKIAHPTNHTPASHSGAGTPASNARHETAYQDRLHAARQISRSPLVNKFGGDIRVHAAEAPAAEPAPVASATTTPTAPPRRPVAASPAPTAVAAVVATKPAAAAAAAPTPATLDLSTPAAALPPQAATQHEAMTRLTPTEPTPLPAPTATKPAWRPHLGLAPNRSRILTTAAAIAIMGGYIWLQNYPKLALQNASNQAGVSASLPGYLPSSYNLIATKTSPGLVTLDFTSPSVSEVLKIAQHRTSWDSNSLLDNFVAKQADAYSTVHGQGLTIYVFGQNQATWVNHGVWYSIEGASKLSREQILKIAYSL